MDNSGKKYDKIFCIGANKTGTTSLGHTLKHLGFNLGNQRQAELLADDYMSNKFERIIDYCKSANVFQDIPFSLPETYKHLDKEFPNAKFILSIRDNPEMWYNSLVNFHNKVFFHGRKNIAEIMKNVKYVKKGWCYNIFKHMYKTPDNDLYNKKMLISFYINHNRAIINYFKDKPGKLLIINVSKKDDFNNLISFLNIKDARGLQKFLHLNKT